MKTLRATIVPGLLIATAAPLSAQAATSDAPARIPVETGFIEARGGVRTTPQGALSKSLASQGWALSSSLLTPAVIAPLGYRVNRNWTACVEFGYGNAQLEATKGDLRSTLHTTTISIQIVGQWVPSLEWERFEPVFGIGGGYYLSTVTNKDGHLMNGSTEANATGVFVSAGLRWAATRNLGLSIEDRYVLAAAGVGSLGTLNAGGNTASLGLYYVWR